MNDTNICPICNEEYLTSRKSTFGGEFLEYFNCRRCGKFLTNPNFIDLYIQYGFDEVRHLVSAWIRRKNKNNPKETPRFPQEPVDANINKWLMAFKRMGLPESISEKLDALLQVYAIEVGRIYSQSFLAKEPRFIAETAALDLHELNGLVDLLIDKGWIKFNSSSKEWEYIVQITAEGWQRIESLLRNPIVSDSAFIAMWFDSSIQKYSETGASVVQKCGYHPIIVNEEEFSGFIMEYVISSIRQARFVIADFTTISEKQEEDKIIGGVRGGVYWEAGMAYGLGKPIIHTCVEKAEAIERIHFDVEQMNTLFWNSEDLDTENIDMTALPKNPKFIQRLYRRIQFLVGQGSWVEE
ncbi:MAG: hypothetical protein A2Y59_01400 [Chloroflexi bacterium RBG_13_52_14]|nr:MAG: hypothetical protein A2Y59_01400 [Chloroflexi bacterium RBG_13_52_14]